MPLRILLMLATIVVLACSLSEDEIIPEMSHAEVPLTMLEQPTNSDMTTKSTEFNHRAKALDTIALIKTQGGGTEECKAAAADLKKSVNDAVETNNKVLGDLSTGSDCPERGQSAVTSCGTELNAAEEEASAAKDVAAAALYQMFVGAGSTLEELMGCMTTRRCSNFEAARAPLDKAQQTKAQKDAAVVAKKDECSDFEKSAARQMADCQCAAKKAHAKAWEAVTSGAAEREKSYKTANELLCALNKDATCKGPPTPTVDAVVLAKGVAGAVCPAKEGGQATMWDGSCPVGSPDEQEPGTHARNPVTHPADQTKNCNGNYGEHNWPCPEHYWECRGFVENKVWGRCFKPCNAAK